MHLDSTWRWMLVGTVIFALLASAGAETKTPPIKAGLIGLDTSHAIRFTQEMNNPEATGELADIAVVAGFPWGMPDNPSSRDRIEGYTEQLRQMGVEIVGSVDDLLRKVDVVLVESVDGRCHLDQARPVIAAGKPLFIDKPLAGSLADAVEIFRLAEEHNVPCFSSSSLRFGPGIMGMRNDPRVGEVRGCDAFSPCPLEEHHPDLFWYGIHGVETLFTIMGPGCKSVTRVHTEGTDVVVGVWEDGRIGTFRGIRDGKRGYGGQVFGTKGNSPAGSFEGYAPLLIEIVKFFKTGKPPVTADETLEVFAFMEAADQSKREGGGPVTLQSVMTEARKAAAGKREAPGDEGR